MFTFTCPNCQKDTLGFFQKLKAVSGHRIECSSCKAILESKNKWLHTLILLPILGLAFSTVYLPEVYKTLNEYSSALILLLIMFASVIETYLIPLKVVTSESKDTLPLETVESPENLVKSDDKLKEIIPKRQKSPSEELVGLRKKQPDFLNQAKTPDLKLFEPQGDRVRKTVIILALLGIIILGIVSYFFNF